MPCGNDSSGITTFTTTMLAFFLLSFSRFRFEGLIFRNHFRMTEKRERVHRQIKSQHIAPVAGSPALVIEVDGGIVLAGV